MSTLTKRSGAKRPSSKSGKATRSAAQQTAPRTAHPRETAYTERARLDRLAAEQRVMGAQTDPRGRATPLAGRQSESDQLPVASHAEHPENLADSTVRHSEPQTGKQSGEGAGGFPQGEYDVTKPAPAAAKAQDSTTDALLQAHFGDVDIAKLEGLLGENRRIDDAELPFVLEALPIGAIIEHEGLNRWRVRSPASGGIRWGHGQTAVHAVEAYVLGDTASAADVAGAQRFLALDPANQKAVLERDRLAAERVGGSPDTFARDEAIKAAQADATAEAPAPNAVTDGPEKASARAKNSAKAPQNTPEKSAAKSASKATSKSTAKKGAAKSGSKQLRSQRSGSRRR